MGHPTRLQFDGGKILMVRKKQVCLERSQLTRIAMICCQNLDSPSLKKATGKKKILDLENFEKIKNKYV